MNQINRIGGISGVAFGILTFAAVFAAAPPGGTYAAADVTSFVASGHRGAVFAAAALMLLATIGFVGLAARLRLLIRPAGGTGGLADTIFWGLSLAGAFGMVMGFAINVAVPIGYANAGKNLGLRPQEVFMIGQIGDSILFGIGGVLVGAAMITLGVAARAALPSWLRWLTLIFGVIALASPAFFPWFIVLIWGVVAGIWLLASPAPAAAPVDSMNVRQEVGAFGRG